MASSKRYKEGALVPVGGTRQRALLALLAVQRERPISAERLLDALVANAANALQVQIGQLTPDDRSVRRRHL